MVIRYESPITNHQSQIKKMSYTILTPATAEPLELAFVKDYLKVDFTDDDALILVLIKAARNYVEIFSGRVLMTTKVSKTYDGFSSDYSATSIELESSPVASVESVKYLDCDGNEKIWATTEYKVSTRSEITCITPKSVTSFPATLNEVSAVTVEYTLGYTSAANVPGAFIQAMLLMIGKNYECRENTIKNFPSAAESLITPYKVFQ